MVFTNTSTSGYTASLWEFGDGATSALTSPTHIYWTPGVYTVTLTADWPDDTDTLTRTNYITVYEPVQADFTATPRFGAAPLIVQFTDLSSGPVATWEWAFGDGETSFLQHPTHTYVTTKAYTVSLTVRASGEAATWPEGTDTLARMDYIAVAVEHNVYLPLVLRNYVPGTGLTNHPPNTPFDPSPPDGSADQSVSVNLSWTGGDPDPGDTVTYDVYFEADDSTPDVLICNDVTSAFCDPGTLSQGTHYYWQVVARDSHGATRTGVVWDFTTEEPPPATLTLISPNGGENWHVGTIHDTTWSSTGSIANVRLEYSKDGFVSDVNTIVASTSNDGSYSWTVPNDPSTTVRVRVSDASNPSTNDISDADWTIFNNSPYDPSNPSPPGATYQPITVTLSWTGGDPDGDSVTYDVYLEAGDSTPDVLVSDDQSGTSYDPGTLITGTHYYWQLVAIDEHGATALGPVWDFVTTGGGAYLIVMKDVDKTQAAPGDTLVYTITILNIGDPAGAVWLTDTLSSGLNYIDASLTANFGSFGVENDVITWTAEMTGYGQAAVIAFSAEITSGTMYTNVINTAQVTGTGQLLEVQVTTMVMAPDFALSATPGSRTVTQGQSVTYTVAVTALHGFADPVVLTVGGTPTDTAVSWTVNPLTPPTGGTLILTPTADATLTITPSVSSPTGTFTLVITGTGGGQVHSVPLALTVIPTGTYELMVHSQPSDGEVIKQGCATWSECRAASSGDLAFAIYPNATVESTYGSGEYAIKRVFLYFDTSTLPVGATIQSVTLTFYAGPYQNGPHLRVHVVQSTQESPLTILDFDQVTFTSGGSADLTANTWTSISFNATGQTWVVSGGITKLALMHDLDLDNTPPAEVNNSVVSMSEDPTHQPYLTVQYVDSNTSTAPRLQR